MSVTMLGSNVERQLEAGHVQCLYVSDQIKGRSASYRHRLAEDL